MSSRTCTTSLRRSAMLQKTYAAALWYLSYIMTIVHTDENSTITASFSDESKHARSSKTAKDCSTTDSGKNHASSSITANKISSETVSGNERSGTTALFGNDSKHASSLAVWKLRKTVRQQSQVKITQAVQPKSARTASTKRSRRVRRTQRGPQPCTLSW